MRILVIIPAHNEAIHLSNCLLSLSKQEKSITKIVVVNDNSTDTTATIIDEFATNYSNIEKVNNKSSATHLPGAKIIDTFYSGLETMDINAYDIICKFDADIIFPTDYIKKISEAFDKDDTLGMCSGLCYVKNSDENWVYENIADKKHVRGPIKAYSVPCFLKIDGLRKSIGWDTVDELLALYHGFTITTLKDLHVKHLRPTGKSYTKKAKLLQGEAMYKMRYKLLLTCIASAKMAFQQKRLATFFNNLQGFLKCKKEKTPFIVSKQEGAFIRKYRYNGILQKLIP